MEEACAIAVKILSKTMDSTTLSSEKSMFFFPLPHLYLMEPFTYLLFPLSTVEFATLGRTADGGIYHHLWTAPEITELLKKHGLAKADADESK